MAKHTLKTFTSGLFKLRLFEFPDFWNCVSVPLTKYPFMVNNFNDFSEREKIEKTVVRIGYSIYLKV